MDDRELLELAARAAGIEALWDETLSRLYIIDGEHVQGEFKPLTDDGDAFRLATKLHIAVHYQAPDFRRDWTAVARTFDGAFCSESGFDLNAATRRAITRAAAAIG